ncbi:MAG: radical SAM protein, partial [Methanotrichaceae archaeon]|nr:radical SAM protein [Methanotrichaceae archaeon]
MEIEVDGMTIDVSSGTTIMQALQELGYQIKRSFSGKGLFMPCQLGGCWACAVDIDDQPGRACITLARPGMKIKTTLTNLSPIRLVGGFMGHSVGGVGTPWWLKGYCIEVACFASGCNFRCPQCQNWQSTYASAGQPLLPQEAAKIMTETRMRYRVNRLAISGGECTLNKPWLLQYLRNLRELNPGACLHVDTNGSILTNDYLDELVCAGMTDIGIDLKALRLSTFEKITGLSDTDLAGEYIKTAWKAIEYLLEKYPTIFLGVGIP